MRTHVTAALPPVALFLLALSVGCTSVKDLVYVTPAFGEGVAAVRAETLEVAWRRAPTGAVRSGRPMHMARSPGKLWVGDLDGPGLVALDPETGETIHSLKLPHEVVGIAVSPDGETLVTGARDALEAYVVNTRDATLRGAVVTGTVAAVASSLPPFFTGHPAVFGESKAFVQDNVNGRLVLLRTDTVEAFPSARPSGPVHCFDVALRPGAERVLIVAEGTADGTWAPRLIDQESHEIVIPLGDDETPRLHHGCFSKDGRFYYVANMGPFKAKERQGRTVALVDLEKRVVVKTARAGRGAGHPILSPDGSKLYVVNHAERFVSVLDARTLAALGEIEAARTPAFGHGVVFTKEGALLVLASADHELVKIVNDKVVGRLDLGAELGELEAGW